MNQAFRVILASNPRIHFKGNPVTRITSQYKKIHRPQRFLHSKPLDLNYKEDSPRGDTKIQSLLLPKGSNPDTSRTSQILFLHLLLSLIRFATKTMPSLQRPSEGRQPQFPPEKASDAVSTISPPRQPGWLQCEKQR